MSHLTNTDNTSVMLFDGKEVEILQINGEEVWNKSIAQIGLDLNYTAIDVNGNLDGSVEFDGIPVAYAVGKPTFKYYKEITPTPTIESGYRGSDIYYNGEFVHLYDYTDLSQYNIVLGETKCYEKTLNKEEASASAISDYKYCTGYNSEYYNGYNFQNSYETSIPTDEQIIPDVLEIPSTYHNCPVTQILPYAFCAKYTTSNASSYYQSYFVKNIIFGKNLKKIGNSAFDSLENYGKIDGVDTITTFNIPEGIIDIESFAFARVGAKNSVFYKIVIPESVNVLGTLSGSSDSRLVICKAKELTSDSSGYLDYSSKGVVFKKSVKSLSGTPFYNSNVPMVFEHTDEDEITINIGSRKSAVAVTIYTDSSYVRNYDWASVNYTPTFYSMSEYTGELE